MAAGFVTLTILDGAGTSRIAQFWSSDGTIGGTLTPPTLIMDSTGAAVDYSVPSSIKGSVASGVAAADPPVASGGLAKTALPTAVADGQVVNALHDKFGRRISPSVLRVLKAVQVTAISSTAETPIATAVASNFLDLYGLLIANTNVTNPLTATIKDSLAGTTRLVIQIPAGETRGFMAPADSGLPQATVNTAWTCTLAGTSPAATVTAMTAQNGA